MEYGLPPTGGWGCGIDRITMFLSNKFKTTYIQDVIARQNLINRLYDYASNKSSIIEHSTELINMISEYEKKRENRILILNKEFNTIYNTRFCLVCCFVVWLFCCFLLLVMFLNFSSFFCSLNAHA